MRKAQWELEISSRKKLVQSVVSTYNRGGSRTLSRGILGVIAILFFKNYIHCNYSHYYFNQQSALSTYCAWSYSLHAAVPAATSYPLMLLYIYTVIYNLACPDPILCRDAIACSISAYTASDNAPMWTRVCPMRLCHLCPLHYHMGTSILLLLSCYQNLSICLFDNSSRAYQ